MKILDFITFSDLSATDMISVSYNLVLSSLVMMWWKKVKKKEGFLHGFYRNCSLDSFSF